MNSEHVRGRQRLEDLIEELTDYKRPVSYNLSELLIVEIGKYRWLVVWRKDGA